MNNRLTPSLDAQALATARAAEHADGYQQQALNAAADTLARQSKRKAEFAEKLADEYPIQELPVDSSPKAIKEARLIRAVQVRRRVFLPTWPELAVGLPNALLRSNLWSAAPVSKIAEVRHVESQLVTLNDKMCLTYSGPQLTMLDQAVLATCLESYRNRPLSSEGDTDDYLTVSFHKFAEALGVSYGKKPHIAIRDSLLRLWGANLRLKTGRFDLPVPRLVDVVFVRSVRAGDRAWEACTDYGSLGIDDVLSSDVIQFRIPDSIAKLYGPSEWSSVHKSAFQVEGLKSFLAGFYATHSRPYPLSLEQLQTYSGLTCEAKEFKRCLKKALTELSAETVDPAIRVASYELTAKHALVLLASWSVTEAQQAAAVNALHALAARVNSVKKKAAIALPAALPA